MKLLDRFDNESFDNSVAALSTEITAESRAVRAGRQMIKYASLLSAARPVAALLTMAAIAIIASVNPAAAQGQFTSGNSQDPISLVQTGITVLVWLMVGGGVAGIAFGILNGMRGRPWGSPVGWGTAAFGFGGIVALLNESANGTQVTLPAL